MDSLAFNLIHRFNVGDSLRRSAKRYPAKAAVRFEGADTSYAELDAKADKVARFFLDRGIARGDAVAFLGLNSLVFLGAFFWLGKDRGAFCPDQRAVKGKRGRLRAFKGQCEGACDRPHAFWQFGPRKRGAFVYQA